MSKFLFPEILSESFTTKEEANPYTILKLLMLLLLFLASCQDDENTQIATINLLYQPTNTAVSTEATPTISPTPFPTPTVTVSPTQTFDLPTVEQVQAGMTIEQFVELTQLTITNTALRDFFLDQFNPDEPIQKEYFSMYLSHLETRFDVVELAPNIFMHSWVKARYFDQNKIERVVAIPLWLQTSIIDDKGTTEVVYLRINANGSKYIASDQDLGGYNTIQSQAEAIFQPHEIFVTTVDPFLLSTNDPNTSTLREVFLNIFNALEMTGSGDMRTLLPMPSGASQAILPKFSITGDIELLPLVEHGEEKLRLFLPQGIDAYSHIVLPVQ